MLEGAEAALSSHPSRSRSQKKQAIPSHPKVVSCKKQGLITPCALQVHPGSTAVKWTVRLKMIRHILVDFFSSFGWLSPIAQETKEEPEPRKERQRGVSALSFPAWTHIPAWEVGYGRFPWRPGFLCMPPTPLGDPHTPILSFFQWINPWTGSGRTHDPLCLALHDTNKSSSKAPVAGKAAFHGAFVSLPGMYVMT